MDGSQWADISQLRLSHHLQSPGESSPVKESAGQGSQGGSFAEAMLERIQNDGVRFSKHAAQRMQTRGVEMTQGLYDSLNQAVSKARSKGSRDVAVISSQSAFIVNVPNNTVITTMNGAELKDNIFTNIDSAVLI